MSSCLVPLSKPPERSLRVMASWRLYWRSSRATVRSFLKDLACTSTDGGHQNDEMMGSR